MNQSELSAHVSELRTHLDEIAGQEAGDRQPESAIASFAAVLFLLRWAERVDADQKPTDALESRDYPSALPRGLHWSSWCHLRGAELVDALGGGVLPALRNAPDRGPGKYLKRLAPIVENLVRESPEVIETLLKWGQPFNLETDAGRQAAGNALAALVANATETGEIPGDHTTPKRVVELMAELLDPRPGERIYDPCFGAGGLLATVADRLLKKATRMPESFQQSVYGVEISPYAHVIGLARVVLAGMDQPVLELGDALDRPLSGDQSSEGFDCILAVPPWGARPQTPAHFSVSATNLETLFLQHVMASLRPGGRAVVALPEGSLFRIGPDRNVRKKLLSDYRVEGVISLPEGALRPYTGIKMSLLLFRREEAKQSVRFMEIEDWPSIRPEDEICHDTPVGAARTIIAEFRNGTPDDVLYEYPIKDLWETPIRELADRGWELIAKQTGERGLYRSLKVLEEDAGVPVYPLNKVAEIIAGVSFCKSATTTHRDDPSVFAGLVRAADLNSRRVQSPSIFLTEDASKRVRSKHRLCAGDVLLTTSGTVGALAVVSEKACIVDAVAAGSVTVIRPGESISPMFLKSVLASDAYQEWIRGHARGATVQRLSARTLRSLLVPAPQVSVQEQLFSQMVDEREDPIAALVRILTNQSEDPVVSWLNGSPELGKLLRPVQPADRVALLERIAQFAWSLRDQVVHSGIHDKPPSDGWLKDLQGAMNPLQGADHVPPGSGSMGPWDRARNRMEGVYSDMLKLGEAVLAGGRSGMNAPRPLDGWLKDLAEAMNTLQGLNHVPRGSGRMALLDGARNRIEDVYSKIKGLGDAYLAARCLNMGIPIEDAFRPPYKGTPILEFAHAIGFTQRISRLVQAELDAILDDVRLAPGVEPDAVVTGAENEIQVRLKNLSPLALRNVRASTLPSIGEGRVDYLAESGPFSFTARIPADVGIGLFPFKLRWRAERLDGRLVSGEMPLAVDVRSTSEAVHVADLGASPYIVGSPIDREEMFFGRQNIIHRIQRQLSISHRANVILLEGNRRTGKTSILKRLQDPDALPGWIVVDCSLQGGQGHKSKPGLETNEVFRLLARDVGWALDDAGLQVWFPDMDPPGSNKHFKVAFTRALSTAFAGPLPFEAFDLYVQAVLEAASPRRVLLMLDEFDKLQEGIDSGITSPQVPENIRYMLHTYPGLSAILTGSRRLKRLREEYWSALFGFGHRIPVSEIPMEDARLLVTRPVEGRLTYVPDARDRVVELCSQQPFLIQSLCTRIFERAVLSEERTVTVGAAESCAEDMTRDNEHFRTLWDYAETERRRFILALCRNLADGPDPITLSMLEMKLEESGVAISREENLGDDLEFLRELELLKLQDSPRGSAYVLAVPLMANWIRQNVDFEHQRRLAVREREDSEIGDGYGRGEGDRGGFSEGDGYGAGRGPDDSPITTEDEP